MLLRSGAAPMTGPLNMNFFRINNMAEATSPGDPVTLSQVEALLAALPTVQTGAVYGFRRTTAPLGWVKENGGTIGNATSGATTRANSDTEALFTLLWTEFNNTALPIQTSTGTASTRGATAAADFAANKRMPLFDSRSRFHRGADDGLAFDVALTVGASQDDGIKNHKHDGTTATAGGFTPQIPKASAGGGDGAQNGPLSGGNIAGTPVPAHAHTFTTNDNTGGLALETRPRSSVLLFCIKL